MSNNDIYNMELHDTIEIDQMRIVRVPGGWIYYYFDLTKNDYKSMGVFIPYNNEYHI